MYVMWRRPIAVILILVGIASMAACDNSGTSTVPTDTASASATNLFSGELRAVDAKSLSSEFSVESTLLMGVKFTTIEGTEYLLVDGPCSNLSGPVSITDEEIIVTVEMRDLTACAPPGDQGQRWIEEFLTVPVKYSQSDGYVIWENEYGSVRFAAS